MKTIKDTIIDEIHETALNQSGVQKRTLNAHNIYRLDNGRYQSTSGFISKEQVQALNEYMALKLAGTELWNNNMDVANAGLQGALVNIGNGARKGNVSTTMPGYLQTQRPYIIMTLPTLSLPENYGHYYGYPANYTDTLGNLSGFTQVSDVHLDGFTCTKDELDEIERLLKEGVIL